MNLSIIMPFRSDGGLRDKQLAFQKRRWAEIAPGAELIIITEEREGTREWENFNKAKLLNEGVRKSTKDNILILDVDMVISVQSINESLENINKYGIILPYSEIIFSFENYGEKALKNPNINPQILTKDAGLLRFKKELDTHGTYFITKENYWKIGGHEERYEGWGGEDGSFIHAATTLLEGGYLRLPYRSLHLWHLKPKDVRIIDGEKKSLYARYKRNLYNKKEMEKIIAERNY